MSAVKGLLKSKTFWFNIAMGVAALFMDNLKDAGLDPEVLAVITGAGNIGLRAITTKALADK